MEGNETTDELLRLILNELQQLNQKHNFIISSTIKHKKLKDELRKQGESSDEEVETDEAFLREMEQINSRLDDDEELVVGDDDDEEDWEDYDGK